MQLKALAYQIASYGGFNALCRQWNRGRIKTLIYHNVLPESSAFPYALTPDEFERHLEVIKKCYNPVWLNEDGEIVGMRPDRVNVLITFDDGFINNYEYVFPLLVKHGLKATFFLIVSCVREGPCRASLTATPVLASISAKKFTGLSRSKRFARCAAPA